MNRVHLVYFACSAHFECLFASLVSLGCLQSKWLGRVCARIDRRDPLTADQRGRLRGLPLDVAVLDSSPVPGYGERMVLTEIEGFRQMLADLDGPGYVAKVDSDVLFLTDDILRRVAQSQADLIGQAETHWESFVYVQGGCYFLSRAALSAVCSLTTESIRETMRETYARLEEAARKLGRTRRQDIPEDATMFRLVQQSGGRTEFIPFHLPSRYKPRICWSRGKWAAPKPTWREVAGRLKARDLETLRQYYRLATGRYSIAHFWSKREMMLRVYHTRPRDVASPVPLPSTD